VDAFRGHLSNRIRHKLRSKNADLVIIPSGMTNQLQSLDVSINKLFKHLVRKRYDAWLNKDNHILTTSGKIKTASGSVIFLPSCPLTRELAPILEHRADYSVSWSFTGGRTSWTGDQLVARPLPKHSTTKTQKNEDTH
jgi:hypothetical protein